MGTRLSSIPPDVSDLLRRGHGIVRTGTARDAGVSADRLARLTRAGVLVRVAAGAYTAASVLSRLNPRARHALMARGFAASCGPDAYLTEWSAVATWQLPAIHEFPMLPAVVRPRRRGVGPTRTPHGRILVSRLPEDHRWYIGDVGVMSRAWATCTIARFAPIVDALITADAAARTGADLRDTLRHMSGWPGIARARWVAEHADPAAETPIETLGRFTCIEFGLPMPVANAWVGADEPTYRVDGLWPFHWAVFEADGALKYDNRSDASRIVARQTEREWQLRRLGLDIARFDWALATRRRADLAGRFAALLADNPVRVEPIRWWKEVPGVGPVPPEPADWPSPDPTSIVLPAGWQHERPQR